MADSDTEELSGCDVDLSVDAVDDEEVTYLPLFPDEVPSHKWDGVFDDVS